MTPKQYRFLMAIAPEPYKSKIREARPELDVGDASHLIEQFLSLQNNGHMIPGSGGIFATTREPSSEKWAFVETISENGFTADVYTLGDKVTYVFANSPVPYRGETVEACENVFRYVGGRFPSYVCGGAEIRVSPNIVITEPITKPIEGENK